jgi:hypothetical protein
MVQFDLGNANIASGIYHLIQHAGTIEFQNVVRALLPSPAGITIFEPWNGHDLRKMEYTWDIPDGINRDQLMVFGFMQDLQTHEVFQVNWVKVGYATHTDVGLPPSTREKFIVFPNPASDQVFIRFDEPVNGKVKIDVFNSLGSLVYSDFILQTDTDTEIMTDKFPDGLYVVRATSGNKLLGIAKLNITR